MIASPSFTHLRGFAADEFNRLRVRARVASLLAKVMGEPDGLKELSSISSTNLQTKRYLGLHNISTGSILGSVGRAADFDGEFRPLGKHLRDRWVNAFLRLESDGWAPIVVHKVGNAYFVEDGHHRVSVAKAVGMLSIEAEVWDHACLAVQPCTCRSPRPAVKGTVRACAAD